MRGWEIISSKLFDNFWQKMIKTTLRGTGKLRTNTGFPHILYGARENPVQIRGFPVFCTGHGKTPYKYGVFPYFVRGTGVSPYFVRGTGKSRKNTGFSRILYGARENPVQIWCFPVFCTGHGKTPYKYGFSPYFVHTWWKGKILMVHRKNTGGGYKVKYEDDEGCEQSHVPECNIRSRQC